MSSVQPRDTQEDGLPDDDVAVVAPTSPGAPGNDDVSQDTSKDTQIAPTDDDSDEELDDASEAISQAVKEAMKAAGPGSPIFVINRWSQHSEYTQGDAITHNAAAARDAAVRIESDTAGSDSGAGSVDQGKKFSGDIAQWWDRDNPSSEDLCRLIAIAVLEGATYQTISAYATALLQQFDPASFAAKVEQRVRPELVGRVLTRLGAYRAREGSNQTERGGREVVFLEDENWRALCLLAAWREFEALAVILPTSLVNLAYVGTREARRSLQEAIATLFAHDPEGVFQRIIKPLAKGSVAQRWVAANSLAAAARNSDLEQHVTSTIIAAARVRHGKGAASVAALCVANEFGRRRPNESASIVLWLAEKWRSLDAALGIAIEALIRSTLATPKNAEIILSQLSTWHGWDDLLNAEVQQPTRAAATQTPRDVKAPSNSRTPEALRFMARPAAKPQFTIKSTQEISEAAKLIAITSAAILNPQDEEEDNATGQPLSISKCPIAIFAESDPAVATATARLLVRLLQYPPAQQAAWSLIREMLRWSDKAKAAGAVAILRSFSELAKREDAIKLREHIQTWQRDPAIRTTIEQAF
jgi:hypothetical protein